MNGQSLSVHVCLNQHHHTGQLSMLQVCTDLALAVVPELIGRVSLLRKGNGSLADPDALKAELESINEV